MSLDFVGCLLSVDCGNDGVFQGTVKEVSEKDQSLLLINPIRNGIPYPKPTVTLRSALIRDVKVLELPKKISTGGAFKAVKTPVKVIERPQNYAEISKSSSFRAESFQPFEHIDKSNKKKTQRTITNDSLLTPLDKKQMQTDFDFEAGRLIFEKLIREPAKNNPSAPVKSALMPDTMNVLRDPSHITSSTTLHGGTIYATEDGSVVPCISNENKDEILRLADGFMNVTEARSDTLARTAAQIILKHIEKRRPVLLLVGNCPMQQAIAAKLSIHLGNRNVRCDLFSPKLLQFIPMNPRLRMLHDDADVTSSNQYYDMVINMMSSMSLGIDWKFSGIQNILSWMKAQNVLSLAIEPNPLQIVYDSRWSLISVLPLKGTIIKELYLCDIGVPLHIYAEVLSPDIFLWPFGDKFYVKLRRNL